MVKGTDSQGRLGFPGHWLLRLRPRVLRALPELRAGTGGAEVVVQEGRCGSAPHEAKYIRC